MTTKNLVLVVDCGNSNIKFGIFNGDANMHTNFRISTDYSKTADEYFVLIKSLLVNFNIEIEAIGGAIISSVVPPVLPMLERAVGKIIGKRPLGVYPGIKTGIGIQTENPKEVGSDLICLAVGATDRHQVPAIIVSFGTATAFVAVSSKNEIVGASIAPGLLSATESLSLKTAKLPEIKLAKPKTSLGRNTIESMRSGIVFGFAGLVDRVVDEMTKEMGETPVIIGTGGLLSIMSTVPNCIQKYDPFLSLFGLKALYDKNMADR
ncbi:MAG: type III pantothenate kinase [Caldisericia bacterium]|nr:type III pantothenate kinase [Caldisericia bacterium]